MSGLTERQRKVFITGKPEQIENAVLEHYERARKAKTLQEEMYWWTAVFNHNAAKQHWTSEDMTANLLREMMLNAIERNNVRYMDVDKIDSSIVYGVDKDTANEIRFAEKRAGSELSMIVDNPDPQMHELQPESLLGFILLLRDLYEVCEGDEYRALAYILVKNDLDKYVEDYISKDDMPELRKPLQELYRLDKVDRLKFIGKSRWFSEKAEASLKEKLRKVL